MLFLSSTTWTLDPDPDLDSSESLDPDPDVMKMDLKHFFENESLLRSLDFNIVP